MPTSARSTTGSGPGRPTRSPNGVSDWTRPGFRALPIHRLGNWRMRIGNRWLRAPFSILYRKLFRRARNLWGSPTGFLYKLV